MTELRTVDRRLSNGDVLEIGPVKASGVEQPRGGGLRLAAVHDASAPEEYAVLTVRFPADDAEALDVPPEAQVLAVTTGTGAARPQAWVLMPMSAYETEGPDK